ncbi:Dihydroanticapsin 7-dehydrogenase [Vanrija pseudolonga]|uniref:Dihydroanticapsin 7-dehydrogenase n=1 Tax=Vanrija pseudolonga TaxID=143232 RepID=A0AAF1BH23_9TREE|nr:Dihydroanticapsin 7-dehydrogenase [Vanrija pseudolonga]
MGEWLVSGPEMAPGRRQPSGRGPARDTTTGTVYSGQERREARCSCVDILDLTTMATGTNPTSVLGTNPAPSLFSLSDRTILVTGGARGLGLTIAHALLEAGADVVAFDLLQPVEPDWANAQAAAAKAGTSLAYVPLDVTDADAVEVAVADAFRSARTPVRGLFHAAGIQLLRDALEIRPDQWRKIIDVNLTGAFLVSAAFGRSWVAQGNGEANIPGQGAAIALVASMSGRVANRGLECAAYNASKAGVAQLARNLGMEWGGKGIRVNSLSPGYIRTALTEALIVERPSVLQEWTAGSLLGRLSTADEFRGPAIFLLSDASSFMTGSDLVVDGGHTAV